MKKSNTKKYPGVYFNENTNTYYVDSKAKSLDGVYVKIKKSGFTTASKAYEYKAKEKDRIESNYACVVKSDKSQFEALVYEFLELEKNRIQLQSVYKKEERFRLHIIPHFKDKNISAITVHDVQRFRTYLANNEELRADSKNRVISVFNEFINHLVLYNKLSFERSNQFKQVLIRFDTRMVPKTGCKGILSFEQFQTFIESFTEQEKKYELIFRTVFQIGARNGEIRAILVKNFDPFKNIITLDAHVTNKLKTGTFERIEGLKTKDVKKVTITQALSTMLQNWIIEQDLKENDYLFFGSTKDRPISEHSFDDKRKKHLAMCDLPDIRIHDFRHSMTTNLIEHGADINAVSDRLGHSSIQITLDTYNHVTDAQKGKLNDLLENLYS